MKRINKTKKYQLLNSRSIAIKELEKSYLNNYNNNSIINNKTIKLKPILDISSINNKERNKKEKNDLNDLNNDKINKKYFETRRISVDWSGDNKDIKEKEQEKTDKQCTNISKLNLSFGENDNEDNMSNNKKK